MRRVAQKHGKIILTILGVVLMITFALPAFQGGNRDPGSIRAGLLNGKKVTNGDLSFPRNEIHLLRELGRGDPFAVSYLVNFLDQGDPGLHWYLLTQDAARYGFDSIPLLSDADLEAAFKAAPSFLDNFLLTQGSGSRGSLKSAIRHGQMIQAYREFLLTSPRPIARLEQIADISFTGIKVYYATVDGTAGWEKSPAPSDDQVKAQFESYKSFLRTPRIEDVKEPLPPLPKEVNGAHFPFGYKYPDRAKVEYLVFSPAALKEKIKPTNDDYNEAFKFYKDHPDDKLISSESGSAVVGPVTKKTFEEVKEALVQRQIDARARRLVSRMVERAMTQADPWRTLPEGDTLKEDKWPAFDKISQDIAKNRDFEGYAPPVSTTGETVLSAEDLNAVPGIGKAFYKYVPTQTNFSFGAVATSVKELAPSLAKRTPLGALSLQLGKPGPVLEDDAGNKYIFRVRSVDPTHVPPTLEEVRPKVVEDLKKLAAYKAHLDEANKFAAAAALGSLETVAKNQNLPFATSEAFINFENAIPKSLQGIRNLTQKAFTLIPGVGASTQPSANNPASGTGVGATTSLENQDQLKIYILQLKEVERVDGKRFADARDRLVGPETSDQLFFEEWIQLESLEKRLNYVSDTPRTKREEEN